MKIVKPLRLGVLYRPFRWQGRDRLGISLLALTDMGATPQLRPESELWQLAASEVAGGVLDMALPKACAEYLVSGYAFDPQASAVSVGIGGLTRSVPVGNGENWPQPVPALGPQDVLEPHRFARIGQQYGEQWLQQDYPGLASDSDWRLFNAASEAQWWPQRDTLPAQARWVVRNMHPQHPRQQGRLPPWQARCFLNRQLSPQLEEVMLRATTVWFFPHREQMILIWQGWMAIAEDDAADVLQLMPALEMSGAPRPLQHYQQVLQQRLDKEQGALCALREQDLLPQALIGPWLDTQPAAINHAINATLQQREQQLREQHRARLAQRGRDIDQLIPAAETLTVPPPEQLPAWAEQLEQLAAERHAEAERRLQGLARPSRPAEAQQGMQQMLRLLQEHGERFSPQQQRETHDALQQVRLLMTPETPPPDAVRAASLRQQVLAIMAGSRDFSGMDLSGADLSQLDLSGANFSQTLLAQARLHHTRLCAAIFDQTSLAAAHCCHSDFSGAQFTACNWRLARFTECCFTGARLQEMTWQEAQFERVSFRQATLENLLLAQLTLNAADFSAASLHKVVLQQCQLRQTDFSHARVSECALLACQAPYSRFPQAVLQACVVDGDSDLQHADFTAASLRQCNFRQLTLTHACFQQARLENCDLSEACCRYVDLSHCQLAGNLFIRTDLRHASLAESHLIGAVLQKSLLDGADFTGANLFRADVSQSTLDAATQLGAAYTRQLKVLPRRQQVAS